MFKNIYAGKSVLVTGHTGFKGGWLSLWLSQLGADVKGYAWPNESPCLYEIISKGAFKKESEHCGDVRQSDQLFEAIKYFQPEFIFHLAAFPLVLDSYKYPVPTIETNIMGTANVLDCVCRLRLSCPVIIVTSDKCYENKGFNYDYIENDRLGGHDIYSASKSCAEIITAAWRRSFFTAGSGLGPVATVRAGNVIGGGDYSPDRIVPDCVRSLIKDKVIKLRNPFAWRPWQHVLDCLSGYLLLGQKLLEEPANDSQYASAFNFGPTGCQSVQALVRAVLKQWPGTSEDVSDHTAPHEAHTLSLSTDKARVLLEWKPVWEFDQSVNYTMDWYRRRHVHAASDSKMLNFSIDQIQDYQEQATEKKLVWTK